MATQYSPVKTEEVIILESNAFSESHPKSHKWKQNIKLGCCAALFVFALNLCLLGWTEIKYRHANKDGITIVYSGDCIRARNIALWSHLAINVASSLLLAAGNVCMQCLAAPTRQEVDLAHTQHKWLDIGVNTVRNISSITWPRRVLWVLLGLSTVPLHLLYNSVIFEAKVVNDFMVVTTSQSFADGGVWDSNRTQCFDIPVWDPTKTVTYLQENTQSLTRLENAACISAYGKQFITDWANLLVVTSKDAPYSNESLLNLGFVWGQRDVGEWICDGIYGGARQCDTPSQKVADAAQWSVPVILDPDTDTDDGYCSLNPDGMFEVSHCLAQPTKEACQVGISSGILIIVLICNLIKIACMIWTCWKLEFEPLVTLGDAITCFLQKPDPATQGCGPMDAGLESWNKGRGEPSGTPWKGSVKSGFGAASARRWIFCNILFIAFWIVALFLLSTALVQLHDAGVSRSLAGIASQGIGKFNTSLTVDLPGLTILGNVLVANTPQFIVSLLYLLYNDLFTRIHIAAQWDSYSRDRKMLRVLNVRQDERDTKSTLRQRRQYVLSLPLRISLPLLAAMMILHWLVSQSLFLAVIGVNDYTADGGAPVDQGYPIQTLGHSPFAVVLALVLGGLMVVGLWVNALTTKIGQVMPVARTCSVAISAACHPPSWDVDAAEKPLSYGVVQRPQDSQAGESLPGHVCFTSGSVQHLVKGELYT